MYGWPVSGVQLVSWELCEKWQYPLHINFSLFIFSSPQLTRLCLEQADIHVLVTEIPESRGSPPILSVVFLRVESTLHINYFPVYSSSASKTNQAIHWILI